MGEGNQSDTQILNNFVETLSAPLQQAMAEGSPKVVVESVTSVVNSLEPELAAAFRSGNPSVIQAVLGGATTTQMVVNDLIRTGSSLTGLPPGVQQLVDQRVKEIQEKQAAENDALKKLVAGTLGVAVMASTAEAGMYYGGEGSQKVDYSKSVNEMNAAERSAYWGALANMNEEQWNKLSSQQQQQIFTNGQIAGDASQGQAQQNGADYAARIAALPPDQRQDVAKDIEENGDFFDVVDGKPVLNPQKYQAAIQQIRKNGGPNVDLKLQGLAIAAQNQGATAQQISAAQSPNIEGAREIGTGGQMVERATQDLKGLVAQMESGHINPGQAQQLTAASYEKADAGMRQVADNVSGVSADVAASAERMSKDNLAARQQVDVAIDQTKVAAKDDVGLSLDDDSPAKTAGAAPRLSINAQPLAVAGMLQPEGVVAANDPLIPVPDQQRPRVASPSQGMGAAG